MDFYKLRFLRFNSGRIVTPPQGQWSYEEVMYRTIYQELDMLSHGFFYFFCTREEREREREREREGNVRRQVDT
jgi:hypothetical protein